MKYNESGSKGIDKLSTSRFVASTDVNNDYIDMMDYNSRDKNAYVSNFSVPRIPKKVVMINDNAPSSPNQHLKMLTNVVAYESKIKEAK